MKRTLLVIVVIASLCAVTVYVSAFYWGRGATTYFSPDTLEIRYRDEWLFPIGQVPVYRSSFSYGRYELVQFLINKKYWAPQHTPNPRWIWIYHHNQLWSPGYGSLSRQLSKNREFWKDWTEQNPEFAARLWPKVLVDLRNGHDSNEVAETLYHAEASASFEELERLLASIPEHRKVP